MGIQDVLIDTQPVPIEGQPGKVLVVDDMVTNRLLARAALMPNGYEVYEAGNGAKALQLIDEIAFDAVLLDVMMPGISGLEVCKQVRSDPRHQLLPIIMLTSLEGSEDLVEGMEVGASEYLRKPFTPIELNARIGSAIRHKRATDRLDDISTVLFTLARMVEARDKSTGQHCDRLAHMGIVIGNKLQLSADEIEGLRRGGVLHDIGKLGIPDHILLKPAKLTDDEWIIMREHVNIGADLCAPFRTMKTTADIVKYHHERWDGQGYPEQLFGEKIPILARIFQILDIYDALASVRPYKKAFTLDHIISIFEEDLTNGYRDPRLAKEFINILKTEPEILKMPDSSKQSSQSSLVEISKSQEIMQRIKNRGMANWYSEISKVAGG